MKFTIQSACQGDAIASVAGNIVENTISSFDLDFTPEELFYLYVAEGKGTIKGQSSAEFALEHLRDSVTMGDISAENMVDASCAVSVKHNAKAANIEIIVFLMIFSSYQIFQSPLIGWLMSWLAASSPMKSCVFGSK